MAGSKCSICLEPTKRKPFYKVKLPFTHVFHSYCIFLNELLIILHAPVVRLNLMIT